MSDFENEMDLDAEFEAMAEQAEHEEADRASRRGQGGNFSYETIKWTGLEPKKEKIVRFLGKGMPCLGLIDGQKPKTPYDARVVRIAKIIDDKGKAMRLVLPIKKDDENFILWRIIDKVNEVEWVPDPSGAKDDKGRPKNVKEYINEKRFPDIFNIVNYSNLPESDPKRKFGLFGKGWSGREVFIANIIDRSMMDWHRENKHTVLLSKNINVSKKPDGTTMEFVDEGVPAFGFTAVLNSILLTYKYWGKYDIGIVRTGNTNPPYDIFNATRTPEKVKNAAIRALISDQPTTDEEEGWERYDLDKLFGVTSYTKIWNRLHITIEGIDAKLGTHYADELKKLADAEAAERAAKKAEEDEAAEFEKQIDESTPAPAPAEEEEAPVRTPRKIEETPEDAPASTMKPESLPGWAGLKAEEKAAITEVVTVGTKTSPWVLKYAGANKMGACPTCKTKSPDFFESCPACGERFVY